MTHAFSQEAPNYREVNFPLPKMSSTPPTILIKETQELDNFFETPANFSLKLDLRSARHNFFRSQSEFIQYVLPQAAQLGIFIINFFTSFLRDATPLVGPDKGHSKILL